MFNLEEHNGKRVVRTVRYKVPYAIAKFYKHVLENSPKMAGSYYVIRAN